MTRPIPSGPGAMPPRGGATPLSADLYCAGCCEPVEHCDHSTAKCPPHTFDPSPILTARVGASAADLMPDLMRLYAKDGDCVRDVTYGRGIMWRNISRERYEFLGTDISNGTDCRALPDADDSVDVLVLDPPYVPAHDGDVKASIADGYRVNETAPKSAPLIAALYGAALAEAARVVKPKGIAIVKVADTLENHRQQWLHVDVLNCARAYGFEGEDLFVFVQRGVPAMRQAAQSHARKNHSYLWVLKRVRR